MLLANNLLTQYRLLKNDNKLFENITSTQLYIITEIKSLYRFNFYILYITKICVNSIKFIKNMINIYKYQCQNGKSFIFFF